MTESARCFYPVHIPWVASNQTCFDGGLGWLPKISNRFAGKIQNQGPIVVRQAVESIEPHVCFENPCNLPTVCPQHRKITLYR